MKPILRPWTFVAISQHRRSSERQYTEYRLYFIPSEGCEIKKKAKSSTAEKSKFSSEVFLKKKLIIFEEYLNKCCFLWKKTQESEGFQGEDCLDYIKRDSDPRNVTGKTFSVLNWDTGFVFFNYFEKRILETRDIFQKIVKSGIRILFEQVLPLLAAIKDDLNIVVDPIADVNIDHNNMLIQGNPREHAPAHIRDRSGDQPNLAVEGLLFSPKVAFVVQRN